MSPATLQGDEEDAGGFTKTCPDIPCVFQISGGLAISQNHDQVEITPVDWERGIVHCVLTQHNCTFLPQLLNSLGLVPVIFSEKALAAGFFGWVHFGSLWKQCGSVGAGRVEFWEWVHFGIVLEDWGAGGPIFWAWWFKQTQEVQPPDFPSMFIYVTNVHGFSLSFNDSHTFLLATRLRLGRSAQGAKNFWLCSTIPAGQVCSMMWPVAPIVTTDSQMTWSPSDPRAERKTPPDVLKGRPCKRLRRVRSSTTG